MYVKPAVCCCVHENGLLDKCAESYVMKMILLSKRNLLVLLCI
jgi:hypothetical protein